MPGEVPGGGRLFANYVDDVVAVPVPGLPKEGFFPFVMVCRVEAELPRAASMREGRVWRRYVPAGEGPSAGLYVILGVVEFLVHAYAKREQLQELAAVVFIDGHFMALGVVQVIHHPREGG